MPRLLLLSNSRNPGGGYLAHALDWIGTWLGGVREVVFVPYAGVTVSPPDYTARLREGLAPLGVLVRAVTEADDPVALIRAAPAIAVGGGNTFALLRQAGETGVLDAIRERVAAGVPYVGWSAGANLACPTVRTTNDMPIVEPASLRALGLVPFQINPHYTDAVMPGHGGESRDERIAEFLELNPGMWVVGLREGSALAVDDRGVTLLGPHALRAFRRGEAARDVAPGASLAFLLAG
jgi:dipeptidase E